MSGNEDIPNPWDGEPDPGPPSAFEKLLFTGPPPAPPRVAQFAQQLADRAKLGFKEFRLDREKIEGMAVDAMNNGEISKSDAQLIFLDTGYVVSAPLVQRYLDAREFELVARYLKHRIMYHPTDWLNARNRLALDGMIAGGEAAMAVGLLREYLKKLRNHTQEQWRAASRKAPKGMTDQNTLDAYERMQREALSALPGHLEIAELELAEIEAYLAEHGSREDNRALDKFREEIARTRARFSLEK